MYKYIEETVEGYELKSKPCSFLAENDACEIVKGYRCYTNG